MNTESLDQRATKLLAFKVGGLIKNCRWAPALFEPVGPGSSTTRFESFSKFDAALWPRDSIFKALKDLNLLKTYTKTQEAGSILKSCFTLLKWPHFSRAYLVTERKHMSIVVGQQIHNSYFLHFHFMKLKGFLKSFQTLQICNQKRYRLNFSFSFKMGLKNLAL